MTPPYPPAKRLDLVEELHGQQVADPYRWLEDPDDPATVEWSAAQDRLAETYLAALPGRESLRERLTEFVSAGMVGAPVRRGDRAFFLRREPGQEHAALLLCEPDGTRRSLVDPGALDPSGLTTLDVWSVSDEGDRLAYQLSVGGDEESLLYVVDVTTGERLDGPIDRCRYSAVAWLPGGDEVFYVRRLPPDQVPDGEELLHRRVYRHRIGTDPDTDVEVWGAGADATTFYDVSTSPDGRWLVITSHQGTQPHDDVWLLDLAGGTEPREVQTRVEARTFASVSRDGRLYLHTNRDAPWYRLCVADPERPSYDTWRDVVPESPGAVLRHVALLASGDGVPDVATVLAAHTRDVCGELSWYAPATGECLGTPEPYGAGSVTALTTRPDGGRECWVGYVDFLTPQSVLCWSADEPSELTVWERAPGVVPLPGVTVNQVHYTSKDGTRVHMFVLAHERTPSAPRPTILYGYGGFTIPVTPDYMPIVQAWLEAGGVYAVANLRGGSEYGEEWHRGGMRERKQNVFDDFVAAGEYLVKEGWTTPAQLGVFGGSNGGLLVGAALTQRPDLFGAVVCSKPLLDMVRYEHHGLGPLWTHELGTVAHAEEFGWLYGYSPYHHVTEEEHYPPVLFTTFEADTRVDPLHARKMCAALQHASAGGPVVLRRELDVGHAARSVTRTVTLTADHVAFLADHLGLWEGSTTRET